MTVPRHSPDALPQISVVVATTGGPTLRQTIARLNAGTLVPAEILVCIPTRGAVGADELPFDNVRIIVCERKGQVRQRLVGFAKVRCEFVLQLDDDMHMEPRCLEHLHRALVSLRADTAVAPTLVNAETGRSVYSLQGADARSWTQRLLHGSAIATPGGISRAALNSPLDFSASSEAVNRSAWLPGGCVLHARANLVHMDYYPFPGKAYGEDVIHSVVLARRGISLFVVRDAICGVDGVPDGRSSLGSFLREMRAEWRWRRHVVGMMSGSLPRLAADIFIKYSRRALPAIARRL